MASGKLFRNVGVVSVLTLLSRILGVVRDSVCAAFFGAGVVWDAFSFAFRIPNLFRRLFGEGALSAAFIPVFTEYLEARRTEDAWRLAGKVAAALTLVLLALLLLGESFLLLLPRCAELSDRWRLALLLTAVVLPYMVLVCLTALAGAILNSLGHFAAPAFAPVILNICWIVAVLIFAPLVSTQAAEQVFVLAAAIVAAGVCQLLLQLAALKKKGFKWRPALDLKDPGLRRIAASMAPVVAGLAAFQLNVLLDGVIAISLAAPEGTASFQLFGAEVSYPMTLGANSVLYYGSRLMQFPLGVFGIALATVAFPALSAHAARKDWRSFSESLTDALGAVVFIGIPAGVGLMLLRQPAIDLVFVRGAFTHEMADRTARVLLAYSAGIWAYCAVHVLTRAFYSTGDALTPAKVAGGMVALNLGLNLTLIWFMREAGLAAATSISAACQVLLLCAILWRRVRLGRKRDLISTFCKTVLATLIMACAVAGTLRLMPPAPERDRIALKFIRLLAPLSAGLAAYFAASALLRVRELRLMLSHLLSSESR